MKFFMYLEVLECFYGTAVNDGMKDVVRVVGWQNDFAHTYQITWFHFSSRIPYNNSYHDYRLLCLIRLLPFLVLGNIFLPSLCF